MSLLGLVVTSRLGFLNVFYYPYAVVDVGIVGLEREKEKKGVMIVL